jgi:hypothetical protein
LAVQCLNLRPWEPPLHAWFVSVCRERLVAAGRRQRRPGGPALNGGWRRSRGLVTHDVLEILVTVTLVDVVLC